MKSQASGFGPILATLHRASTALPAWEQRRDGFPFGRRPRIEGENETF